jgi:hypothetical protein
VLAAARPDVLERVRASAYNYFRLANREWTTRACDMLIAEGDGEPIVQLHGDAHVEQFAYMKDAWGLDDFDDAARGPAGVDILRFLGSLDLAARQRGWSRARETLFDRFFDGYRRGLSDPQYRPPEPAVVRRHKAAIGPASGQAFLASAEAKMKPLTELRLKGTIASMGAFSQLVRRDRPDLPDGYFNVIRAGALELGIGSAATPKVLIRVEGPSSDPADDVLLEAKAVRSRAAACLEQPDRSPTFRIVQGDRQVGRLKHELLVAGPEQAVAELAIQGDHLSDWWIRSWDPTYHEIALDDLQSPGDLADIAYDSGVQLGAGAVAGGDQALRQRLAALVARAEPRLRHDAGQLLAELLRGWRGIGHR